MNYINNGDYYIVAKYRDIDVPEIIPLKQSWYLEKGHDELLYGNDIAAIDLLTTKFSNIDDFQNFLIKEKHLKNNFVDLYIVHKHKYHNRTYLNTTELLFNQKDYRTTFIQNLANKRLKNAKITIKDIEAFYNRFLNKINNRLSFKKFITMPFKPNNEYFSLEILKTNNALKLKYNDAAKSYINTRNFVNMWNLYDVLSNHYNDIDEDTLGDFIVKEYVHTLDMRNSRHIYDSEVLKLIDKNQVMGQMTFDDYLNTKEEPKRKTVRERNQEELEEYKQGLLKLQNDERRIREEEEFDNPRLRDLAKKTNIYELPSYLTSSELRNLTPKDRLKLGFIDIVGYNNEMRKLDGKQRN